MANQILLDDLWDLIWLHKQDFFLFSLLFLLLRGHTEDIPIVSDHDLEGLHKVLCKDEVVGGELKWPKEVGCHDRGKIVHVHLVVLALLGHFQEELDDKDEYIPVNWG